MPITPSELGYVSYASQPTSGTYVSPTDSIMRNTNTMWAPPDVLAKDLATGTLDAARLYRNGKIKASGALGYPLWANQGALFYQKLLGSDTLYPAAGTPITVTGNGTYGGGFAQLTFGSTTAPQIGGKIVVAGVSPSTWNGTYVVASSGTTSVTFAKATDPGAASPGGTITPYSAIINTYSSPISTANGVSTITGVSAGSYLPGQWVVFGTGATAEARQVWSWDSVGKVMTVKALILNAASPSGTFTAPAMQHRMQASNSTALRLMSFQDVRGPDYYIAWTDVLASKLGLAGGKDFVEATYDVAVNKPPQILAHSANDPAGNPVSALSFSTAEKADIFRTFAITDGGLSVWADPYAVGSSALSAMPGITDWTIDIDLGIREHDLWDDSPVKYHSYGARKLDLKFTALTQGGFPDVYRDAVSVMMKATHPAFAGWAIPENSGILFSAVGLYFPALQYTVANDQATLGSDLTQMIEAHPVADFSQPNQLPVEIWAVNSFSAAYV